MRKLWVLVEIELGDEFEVVCTFTFFLTNKRHTFIQIDRVHRYNTNPNLVKTQRMNL